MRDDAFLRGAEKKKNQNPTQSPFALYKTVGEKEEKRVVRRTRRGKW